MEKKRRQKKSSDKRQLPFWLGSRYLLLVFYIVLTATAYFFPSKLWPLSLLFLMPIWVQILCGIILFALFSNVLLYWIEQFCTFIGKLLFGERKTVGFLVFAIISLAFLVLASNDNVFIGDSHIVESMVNNPQHEDMAIYRMPTVAIYRLWANIAPNIDTWTMINYLHILLGLFFCMVCFLIARLIFNKPEEKGAFFVLLFASYPVLVFTHIEFYAVALLFIALFWYLVAYWLTKRGKPFFIIGNIVSVVFHHLSVLLVPISLNAYLLRRNFRRIFLINIVAFVLMVIVSAFIPMFRENFVIFTNPSYIFKPGFLVLTIMYAFAAAPFGLFAISAGKEDPREMEGSDAEARDKRNLRMIFALGSLWAILALHALDFSFGANDWDVTTVVAFPIFLYCAFITAKTYRRAFRSLAVGVSFVFIIMHIVLGLSYDIQAERQRHLVLGQTTPYFDEQFPPLFKLATIYAYESDLERSMRAMEEFIGEHPYDIRGYNNLASIYSREERYDKAVEVIKSAMQIFPESRDLRSKYFVTSALDKLTRDGIVSLDPDETSDRLNRYAVSISLDDGLLDYVKKTFEEGDTITVAVLIREFAISNPDEAQAIRDKYEFYKESDYPDSAKFYGRLVSFMPR